MAIPTACTESADCGGSASCTRVVPELSPVGGTAMVSGLPPSSTTNQAGWRTKGQKRYRPILGVSCGRGKWQREKQAMRSTQLAINELPTETRGTREATSAGYAVGWQFPSPPTQPLSPDHDRRIDPVSQGFRTPTGQGITGGNQRTCRGDNAGMQPALVCSIPAE